MRDFKKFLLLFLLLSVTSLYSQNMEFTDFDTDNDWWIEKNEFIDKFVKLYSEDWDNTNDTKLDDEDFYLSTYMLIDKDNDDILDQEEWDFGFEEFFGEYITGNFDMHDYDDDNIITYEEYFDSLYDTDYFLTWDVDKDTYLSQFELGEAVFENWDRNNNGVLGRGEFNGMDEYFLDI